MIGADVRMGDCKKLSDSENAVIFALAEGKTPTEIADQLNCGSMELRTLEINLMRKLGAKTKTHLITKAFSMGVILCRTLCLILALSQFGSAIVVNDHDWARINRLNRTPRSVRSKGKTHA